MLIHLTPQEVDDDYDEEEVSFLKLDWTEVYASAGMHF
jgi:hypothetical protein